MEGYLKNLLHDLDQSQSSKVRIIDDNFNSSFGSLKDHRRRRDERKRGVRRTKSLNTTLVFEKISSNDHDDEHHGDGDDFDESSRSLRLTDSVESDMSSTRTAKNKKNGVHDLSARMERHRQTRWSAAGIPPPPARHSLSPGVLRERKRYNLTHKTESLHSSLELGNLVISRRQRKPVSIVRDSSSDDREAISCSRDYNSDRVLSDRFSTASLSAGLFETSGTPLSNESVINQAIAISSEHTMDAKTRVRRVRRSRPSKAHSLGSGSSHAPPSIPVRKGSMERGCRRPTMEEMRAAAKARFQVPPVPVRRRSFDDPEEDANVSPKLQQSPKLEIPIVLRDLPYQKGRKAF